MNRADVANPKIWTESRLFLDSLPFVAISKFQIVKRVVP